MQTVFFSDAMMKKISNVHAIVYAMAKFSSTCLYCLDLS